MRIIDLRMLRRRLARWSPSELQLQPLSYGRILTGEIELLPESYHELMRRLDALEQQAGRHDVRTA